MIEISSNKGLLAIHRENQFDVAVVHRDGRYQMLACNVIGGKVVVCGWEFDRGGHALNKCTGTRCDETLTWGEHSEECDLHKLGSSMHLAAFRTWHGFWVVIDTAISGALNAVDSALEDE